MFKECAIKYWREKKLLFSICRGIEKETKLIKNMNRNFSSDVLTFQFKNFIKAIITTFTSITKTMNFFFFILNI